MWRRQRLEWTTAKCANWANWRNRRSSRLDRCGRPGALAAGEGSLCLNGGLIPGLYVHAYGFAREVHAHFLFGVRSDGTPCFDLSAGEFLRLIILACGPIRGLQDLEARDKIAKSRVGGGSGSFEPITDVLCTKLVRMKLWRYVDGALRGPCQFDAGIRHSGVGCASAELFKGVRAGFKNPLEP